MSAAFALPQGVVVLFVYRARTILMATTAAPTPFRSTDDVHVLRWHHRHLVLPCCCVRGQRRAQFPQPSPCKIPFESIVVESCANMATWSPSTMALHFHVSYSVASIRAISCCLPPTFPPSRSKRGQGVSISVQNMIVVPRRLLLLYQSKRSESRSLRLDQPPFHRCVRFWMHCSVLLAAADKAIEIRARTPARTSACVHCSPK